MSYTKLYSLVNDHSKFGAWLKKKRPQTIVGACAAAGACPIAKFILESGCTIFKKGETVDVHADGYNISIGILRIDENRMYPRLTIILQDG